VKTPMRKRGEHRQDCEGGECAIQGWRGRPARRPPPAWRAAVRYISMVLRIRPTARPSISKGSPGCTVITG
jgi:hypothetical protein